MSVPSIARLKAKLESAVASAGLSMVSAGRPFSEPGSALTGEPPDVEGAPRPANLLTMLTAIRPGGAAVIRRFFDAVRLFPQIKQPLVDLAFIRAAHWTIVDELYDGHEKRERLDPPYLLFESTYDVDLDRYIALFAERLPWHMRAVWGTGVGYPGVIPSSGFARWVRDHCYAEDHVYRAYPEATTRMVRSGLRVADRVRAFEAAVAGADDDEFAFEFGRVLVELQDDI